MGFCEQCGAKLLPGVRFCEQCGALVSENSQETEANNSPSVKNWYNSFAVFKSSNWKREWQKVAEDAACEELGIVMTEEATLVEQLGADANEVREIVADYMRKADKRGVHYYYLDLNDNAIECVNGSDVAQVIDLLLKIVNIARPKYLFILGNEEIIDVATWNNEAKDSDDVVYSDLAYTTLDSTSPWEGQDFNAVEALRVGRLPTTEGHFNDFQAYFTNASKGIGKVGDIRPYGLSALTWEEESNDEYSHVTDDEVDTCPNVTLEEVGGRIADSCANLLFFNLHGSDEDEYWYGQRGNRYPQAISPEIFKDYPQCFLLGVEACYGAKFIGLDPEESIVKTALSNKCLAFLGSSMIAYGTPSPKGNCADIVIGEFIKRIAKGESAGDSYVAGLRELTSVPEMDDADVKTLAEFALYGDPSSCTGKNKNISTVKGIMKKLGGVPKGIHIPMPDVRKATKLYLAEVDAKIEQAVDSFVATNLMPLLQQKGVEVEQKIFKAQSGKLNQKLYSVKDGRVRQVVKVYFDDKGKIHKALLSK